MLRPMSTMRRPTAWARSACLVAVKGTDNGIAKQIAMHIAAFNPLSLSEADLDADRGRA